MSWRGEIQIPLRTARHGFDSDPIFDDFEIQLAFKLAQGCNGGEIRFPPGHYRLRSRLSRDSGGER